MADVEAQKGRRPYPDRLDGFPSFAHFMSDDNEGAIFRRFDYLSARNILYLQSNVNELRAKLDKLDRIDAERGPRDTRIRLAAKAYSDLKAKAKQYEKEPQKTETMHRRSEGLAKPNDRENTIGADAFERLELHKQIKEALRDYRKSPQESCCVFWRVC